MYKQCKTVKTVQRQKEFEETLLAMMERMDYHDISVSALCREMNVQRKTFYRYFDGIEDVLNAVIDEVMQEAFLFLEDKPEIEGFFEFWKGKKRLLDCLARHQMSGRVLNRAASERVILKLDKDLSNLTIKSLRGIAYVTSFMSVIIVWHRSGMKQSPEELAEMVKQMYAVC